MNGRLEATEVDVAAKYPGRLATLTVNEGEAGWTGRRDHLVAGDEAQPRGAQARARPNRPCEAVALIAQRKSDWTFPRRLERPA
jgi:HlyD family secretion protein